MPEHALLMGCLVGVLFFKVGFWDLKGQMRYCGSSGAPSLSHFHFKGCSVTAKTKRLGSVIEKDCVLRTSQLLQL